jgi:hypothetical protein
VKKLFEGLLLYLKIRKIKELRVKYEIDDFTPSREEFLDINTSEEINLPQNFIKLFDYIYESLSDEIHKSFMELDIPTQDDDFGSYYNVILNVNPLEKNILVWTEINYKDEQPTGITKVPLSELSNEDRKTLIGLLDFCECDVLTIYFHGDQGEFIIEQYAEGDSGSDVEIGYDIEQLVHDLTTQIEPHWYSNYGGYGSVEVTRDDMIFNLTLYDYETMYDSYERIIDINFFNE